MVSPLRLLTVVLAMLSLPADLHAECAGCSQLLKLIGSSYKSYLQVAGSSQTLEKLILQMKKLPQKRSRDKLRLLRSSNGRTYSVLEQNHEASQNYEELRRLDCNSPVEGNSMLAGITDDEHFSDLDFIKCVNYDSVHLGLERLLKVSHTSSEYVSCGKNEVMTGFGASDDLMVDIVHAVCREVGGGATVTDECLEVTVNGGNGTYGAPPATDSWPVQCPDSHPDMNVLTGVVYEHNPRPAPRWKKMRCCKLCRLPQ